MAHFVLEYSENIPKEHLLLQALFEKLHSAAESTDLFPFKGIRSRAHACSDFRVADGNPNHIFIHLSVLIGNGRAMEEREHAAKLFFNVLSEHFSSQFDEKGVAMSFEMRELEPVLKYNKNNIQEHL